MKYMQDWFSKAWTWLNLVLVEWPEFQSNYVGKEFEIVKETMGQEIRAIIVDESISQQWFRESRKKI